MIELVGFAQAALVPDWRRHLRARNLSPGTIRSYLYVAESFCAASSNSGEQGTSDEAASLPAAIETYLADLLDRTSATNAAKHYRSLQQWFKWLVDEGEITANPMIGMRPPRIPEKPVAIFTNAELIRLLDVCKGNSFLQRRNAALARVPMDTGIRAAELCGLQLGDVDLDVGEIRVLGKGRRPRVVPISAKTSESISRYLRQRNKHPYAALSSLWLSNKGALTTSGLGQIIDRIGLRANVKDVYPHRFRRRRHPQTKLIV